MNEDPMQELEPRAGDELDRLIGRYARVRLDPSPAQTRRARAAVMEEAWRRRLAPDLASAASTSRDRTTRRRRGPFASWGGRRVGTAFAAAVLAGLVLGSSAFAASRAGGPLYDARLSLEALTLPSDPTARLEAELARAQSRIAEIAEAASRGDGVALNAAVGAYASTLADIDHVQGEPAGRARDAVILHQAVLRDLLQHVPRQAQGGIERAIDNSATAIDRLDAASAAPAATPAGPGNPNAGGENPNAGGGNPNAGGGNPNAGGGNPNAGGGNDNGGGNPNAGGGNDNGGGNQGGGGNGGGNQNAGGGGKDGGGNANEDKSPKPDRSKRPNKPTATPSD
jgi:hypothetical protein